MTKTIDSSGLMHVLAFALACIAALAGCSGLAQDPDSAQEIRVERTAGECHTCGFVLDVTEERATFSSNQMFSELEHDPQRFAEATADLDGIVIGDRDNDCGREVDGNADVLTFDDFEVDKCFVEVDDNHPVIRMLDDLMAQGRRLQPWPERPVLAEATDPDRWSDLLDMGGADTLPASIAPADCPTVVAFEWLPLGSAWVVVEALEDRCHIWLGGETEDPLYDGRPTQFCVVPFAHPPIEVAADQGGPAVATDLSPDWCERNP